MEFFTKSDFYKHKEKVHDEKKKYTKEQNRTISFKQQITKTYAKIQNNFQEEVSLLTCEKLSAPKKLFLHKWQNNSLRLMRAPLTNMQNTMSRRGVMKRTQKIIKRSNFVSSTKENVKIYNITDRSKEGIDRGLNSIEF